MEFSQLEGHFVDINQFLSTVFILNIPLSQLCKYHSYETPTPNFHRRSVLLSILFLFWLNFLSSVNFSQRDLSDLDLETLAPYIPMDGEDFQLNPIIPESEPLDRIQAGSMGSNSSLGQKPQSFSNIASLFQPLSSPPQAQGAYQHQSAAAASWAAREKRGSSQVTVDHTGSCMMGHMQNPPYRAPASTPLSSMGGRQNLQWPPDPLLTYQQRPRATKSYLMDTLSGEERLSCQQSVPQLMQKQR